MTNSTTVNAKSRQLVARHYAAVYMSAGMGVVQPSTCAVVMLLSDITCIKRVASYFFLSRSRPDLWLRASGGSPSRWRDRGPPPSLQEPVLVQRLLQEQEVLPGGHPPSQLHSASWNSISVLTVLAVKMNLIGRNDPTLHLDFAWSCLYASYGPRRLSLSR